MKYASGIGIWPPCEGNPVGCLLKVVKIQTNWIIGDCEVMKLVYHNIPINGFAWANGVDKVYQIPF